MKLGGVSNPRLWIAIASAAAVLCFALVDLGATSPGPLASVHEREPELAGRAGCAACHGGWFRSMTDACLACHEDVGGQLEEGAGLHGSLAPLDAARCALCHSDHHGAGFQLVNRQSFALAGVPDPNAFDHRRVGFEMEGKHLELTCAECHPNADAALLPPEGKRFLGLEQDCASCHDDPHEGRIAFACASCHDQESFESIAFVEHAEHLPLVGGHAGLDCRACHAESDAHALELLGEGPRRPRARACVDCHESPHVASFVRGAARASALPDGASCVACHAAEHASFREEGLALDAAQHAASGFVLDPPHDRAACADCHAPDESDFAARYPGRGQDDCASCHDDPHGDQFADSPFAAAGCVACHARERFEPHAFGVPEHARAGWPLTGSHLALDCAECHAEPAPGAPRTFRGTAARCELCHEDAHAGAFARFADELAAEPEGDCARCHATTRFAEVPEHRFDHGEWTGFPVRGAHAQAECAVCHPARPRPDERGRRFGFVADRFGVVEDCGDCHADPHGGAFDGETLPASVEGRAGCARCHAESSFRHLPGGFDHGLWTGFPLADAHAGVACSACHSQRWSEDALVPGEARRRLVRGPAPGRSCSECHADPHAGQFAAEGGGEDDCMRCHQSAASFTELVFDHQRDARFALDDAHARLSCSACHMPFVEDGARVVRYKPLGTECADCHGDQKQPLRRKERKKP